MVVAGAPGGAVGLWRAIRKVRAHSHPIGALDLGQHSARAFAAFSRCGSEPERAAS
jgi:hypothetical protein